MRWSRVGWPAIGYVSLEDDDGYADHLAHLLADAPPTMAVLAAVRWENGRFRSWRVDGDTIDAEVVTVGRELVDDREHGPYQRLRHARVTLRFHGAAATAEEGDDPSTLDLLAGDVRSVRGELDRLGDDQWELRVLVQPTGQLTITFDDASLSIESVSDAEEHALEERPAHGWNGPVPDGWVRLADPAVRFAAEGDLGGLTLTITRDHVDVNALDPRWGVAPLHAAAWFDRAGVVPAIVEAGAVVDLRDAEDRTPLTLAIDRDAHSAVDELITHGADLEARDGDGNTPIVRAAYTGRAAIVRALAAAGARLDARGTTGATILIAAADANDADTVRAVLDLGASRTDVDEHGHTALERALLHRDRTAADLLAWD